MWDHIKINAKEKGIFIDFINGHTEHCHCLVSLGSEQTISNIMQLITGGSAHWFNQQNFSNNTIKWQNDYFAVSVSESILNKVREYIKTQEVHHTKKKYQQKVDEFVKRYGFKLYKDE